MPEQRTSRAHWKTLLGEDFENASRWLTPTKVIASAIPNSSLKHYEGRISRGEILMIVNVPYQRIRQIRALVQQKCGDSCDYVGITPVDHVMFP